MTSPGTNARIVALGGYAAAALSSCSGDLEAIPGFAQTPYRFAGAQIVWLGTDGEAHPRAVFLDRSPGEARLAWDRHLPAPTQPAQSMLLARDCAAGQFGALARACRQLGAPLGCACLLAGGTPPFPLSARVDAAHALAAAVAADAPEDFTAAGLRLLGVGGGLTPSGDDFVGAALFTLAHLEGFDARWRAAAAELVQGARSRTHAISAALFEDLAHGESFAALHDLIAAAGSGDAAAMLASAHRLVGIGHSSGWDMLGGMIAAATGTLQPSTS